MSEHAEHEHFTELTVQRLNIVDADGTTRLVLTNKDRYPPAVLGGKPVQRVGAGAPPRTAGIVFYNEDGDECGGLGIHGREVDGVPSAWAALLFDQYGSDQAVGIYYADEHGQPTYGVTAVQRPQGWPGGGVFVGWSSGRPVIRMADSKGRDRIRLRIDDDDSPKLEFLDEHGHVASVLSPETQSE